jgi:monoamine oxidase
MTPTTPDDVLDVAIVGGGISGLYVGWRLLTGKPESGQQPIGRRIVVFELSKRTGGRLLTWRPFPDNIDLHAELGGMRFFKQQQLVWSLMVNYFEEKGKLQHPIKFYVTDPNGNNLWYLRERILKTPDLSDPDKVPYRLDAATQYADPFSIINGVIGQVLIANREVVAEHLGGRTRPLDWQDWDAIKPYLRYNGRRLWDTGFWNLLSDLLSPASYAFVTDAFGYYSVTNNWNAAEAMQSIYSDFTQDPDYQTLREGYDYLPYLVRQEFQEAGGEVRLNTPVASIARDPDGLLQVWLKGSDKPILARNVVLAMPRRSLELLGENSFWRMDRPIRGSLTLGDFVRSVIHYPAFKLFLAYGTRWWHNPPISIAAGRSVSYLPIRQTYYFPPVPQFPPQDPPQDDHRGLVMASYNDFDAVLFWRALEAPEDQKSAARDLMRSTIAGNPFALEETALAAHVNELNEALPEEPGFHFAPTEMTRHAQQQLQLLHFNQPLPDPLSVPGNLSGELLAAYKDWGHDPYGGGWNFWAPLVDVKAVMEGIRRPFADANLYIVGEAYSGTQGWVEGALTTAERALRDYFHLAEEPWQPKDYYIGY